MRRFAAPLLALVALGTAACRATRPPAASQARAVPVYEEPRHRPVFQNRLVRVLDVQVPAGETTQYHVHAEPYVGVAVGSSRVWDQPLGAARGPVQNARPIPYVFDNWTAKLPYTHRVGNVGTTPFHYVVGQWLASSGCTAASLHDAPTRRLVQEGRTAWVYEVRLPPHSSGDSHTHACPGLTILATGGLLDEEITRPAASGGTGAGRWSWRETGHAHVMINTGDSPLVLYEIDWR